MGAGKTTVVGPLLSLILADGETLVTQVMPPALLEQTWQTLRDRLSGNAVLARRVYTLQFDRQCEDDPEPVMQIARKLELCRISKGVLCAPPEAVKSLALEGVVKAKGCLLAPPQWSRL